MSNQKKHNDGQKVGSQGTYKQPISLMRELTTWSKTDREKLNKELKAFNKGFVNGRNNRPK